MEKVKQYFIARGAEFLVSRIQVFSDSSATVELAAQRLQCQPAHIAKSISYVQRTVMSKEENKRRQRELQMQKNEEGKLSEEVAASPVSPTAPPPPNIIIIVTAGDARVNAKKYKAKFLCTPQMLKREDVEKAVGYPAGGVCPFGVNDNVQIYLDVSLKRFTTVYPACGTDNTGIGLSIPELEEYATNFVEWVDLCDGRREEAGAEEAEKPQPASSG